MYENPELLLSAELQLILVEILYRKRTRIFTANNFKQIDLVFFTYWFFSISFHHSFSHWNLLTPYKILKAMFFCYNMWQKNSFEYVVGNTFLYVLTVHENEKYYGSNCVNNNELVLMNVKQAFQSWSLKNISEKSWHGIVPVTEKMHFRVHQEAAYPSQCSCCPRAGFTNFKPAQFIAEIWVSVFFPHSLFFLVVRMDYHWMPQHG